MPGAGFQSPCPRPTTAARFTQRGFWQDRKKIKQKIGHFFFNKGKDTGYSPFISSDETRDVMVQLQCKQHILPSPGGLVAQSCPTLCHPMDCSPPDSSVHGDSPGENTGVSSHAFFQGIFPTQGLNPCLMPPELAGGFLTTSVTWKALPSENLRNFPNCHHFLEQTIKDHQP